MRRAFGIAITAIALITAACAGGQSGEGTKTVAVEMRDNAFEPASLSVDRGETVTFRFTNRGKVAHDAFIGDEEAQDAHEEEMKMADDDAHGAHGMSGEGITVQPGETGTITHTFDERGETLIGCHQPGHYAVGMVATIAVR